MTTEKRVSAAPRTFVSGGILDDANVTVKSARTMMWDYDGKRADETPALEVVLVDEEDDSETSQYWSAGTKITPHPSGKYFTGSAALSPASNLGVLLASLVNAGYDEDRLDAGDFEYSELAGSRWHVIRAAAPERSGLANTRTDAQGNTRQQTVLIVDEILAMPGEKKKKSKGKSKKSEPAAAAASDNGDVSKAAKEVIKLALTDEDNVPKSELPGVAFDALKDDVDMRGPVTVMVTDDEFLNTEEEWTYADGIVSAK